ncbi:MAG: FkbM family methyltransferase [Terriglobales bacterium]
MSLGLRKPAEELRRWLGPLGRYRPGLFRKDMAEGFHNCDAWTLPPWARLLRLSSPEERLLQRIELAGAVVYDVGAFTGAYSLFFSRQVGEAGRVIAFEPRAESYAKLVANLERNRIQNVLPLPIALGATAGRRALFMLPGMPTTASLAPEALTPLRRKSGEVEVQRLDVLIASIPLPPPRLLKVDVEGLEMEVLEGAKATLEQYRPDLLIEVHGDSGRHKTQRVDAMCALLRPLGYSLLHAETGVRLDVTEHAVSSGHIYAQAA